MKTIYWDIETTADAERVEACLDPFGDYEPLPDENPEGPKLGRLTDPAKIAAKIESDKEKWEAKRVLHREKWEKDRDQHVADAHDKGALSPRTAEILTIQLAVNDDEPFIITTNGSTEADLLRSFWDFIDPVDPAKMVNWTGNNKSGNFDLNMVLRRSWAHGIRTPFINPKLWKDAAQEILRFDDWGTYYGLEKAARELGLEVEDTAPVTGKTFAQYWLGDDEEMRAKAETYAIQDVILVREIWKRVMGA